jgi:hypothetical protein
VDCDRDAWSAYAANFPDAVTKPLTLGQVCARSLLLGLALLLALLLVLLLALLLGLLLALLLGLLQALLLLLLSQSCLDTIAVATAAAATAIFSALLHS